LTAEALSGENLSCDFIYTDSLGNRIGHRLGISGDHCHPDAKAMKLHNALSGFGPNLILDGESAQQFPFGDAQKSVYAVE